MVKATGRLRLRSSALIRLLISRTHAIFGNKVFSVAGTRVWNNVLTDLGQPNLSQSRFRQSLKTFYSEQWDQAPCELPFNCLKWPILCRVGR